MIVPPTTGITEAIETILIVGVSHRSSSLTLRDQVYLDEVATPIFLRRMVMDGITTEVAVLSTTERVEVIAITSDPTIAVRSVTMALAEQAGLEGNLLIGQLYHLTGVEAVRHCFSVAAGLDSLIVGDLNVLRKLTEAQHIAHVVGTSTKLLAQLLSAACRVAKRVHTETGIADGPVSIAAAVVQLARHLYGNLTDRQVLLVGTGDIGWLVVDSLRVAGVRQFVATTPYIQYAEIAATDMACHIVPFADLVSAMATSDIVVSSVSDCRYVIGAESVRQALRQRRQRPIFLVDTGIPGDVEPAANKLNSAFLYDLNDLERVAMEGRVSRERATRAAWDIVTAEVAMFILKEVRERKKPQPILEALRQHFENVRIQVLSEVGNNAERATQLLIARLLCTPSEALQRMVSFDSSLGLKHEVAERILRQILLPNELVEYTPTGNANPHGLSGGGLK